MPLAPIIAAAAPGLLSGFLSIFGIGGGSQPTQQTQAQSQAQLNYTPPTAPAGSTFDWQASAPAWAAIGIVLLALLLLGSFNVTRPLAIAIAIILGFLLLIGKVQ